MLTRLSNNAGNSSAEEKFVQLFAMFLVLKKGSMSIFSTPL